VPVLRRSPLDDRHRARGATMTGFGGWEMPLDYGSVVAEHRAVRTSCGVFDLSHLGTVRVTGDGAQACLRRAFTNDVAQLAPGRAHYTLCLNTDGGIVDDLLVYHLDGGFFVVPNAANAAAVGDALTAAAAAAGGCEVVDVKDHLACLAVQGPDSAEVVTGTGCDVGDLAYLDCRATPGGLPPAGGVLARSGYTGERGYELFLPAEHAAALWDRLVDAGATPAGLGSRDTLRLEMGYPLHGQDITPATSPVEARLGWAVKGSGFVGEEAYRTAQGAGAPRLLWGLRATGRGIPRAGCVVHREGEELGAVTSGSFSPTLRVGIAMGYVDATPGERVEIDVRGKTVAAEVVRPPFVDASPKR